MLHYGKQLLALAAPVLVGMGVLYVLEVAFPMGRRPELKITLRALSFWALYLLVQAVVVMAYAALAGATKPLVTLPFSQIPYIGWTIAPALAAILADFFYYWMHRAQHRWFWRFHAVHHSIQDLSAVNSYNHLSEEIFRRLFIAVPMTYLLGSDGRGAVLVALIFGLHGYYIHSATRLNLGPLRILVADNRYHRIHHSVEERHWDKNFAATTPLWDLLFGTCRMPGRREWPDTGLVDQPAPETLWQYVAVPFRSVPPVDRDDRADREVA